MNSKRKYWLGLVLAVLLLSGSVIAFFLSRNSQKTRKKTQATDIQDNEFGDTWDARGFLDCVRSVLPDLDTLTQLVIVSQAMHETGVFTSTVFKRNNNAFGMRLAKKRKTTAIGDPDEDGYANYDSVEDSIEDLKLWFDYHNIPLRFDNVSEYSKTIKELGYYEASYSGYTGAMKKHFNKISNYA